MKAKSLYLPVLVLAFLLASEMPKVHGMFELIQLAGRGVSHLLIHTAAGIDAFLTKPTRWRPSMLVYKPELTLSQSKPDSIVVRGTEEASQKPDTSNGVKPTQCRPSIFIYKPELALPPIEGASRKPDTSDGVEVKSSSTGNNKSESDDNKDSVEKNSSLDTTDEVKKKSSSKKKKTSSGKKH